MQQNINDVRKILFVDDQPEVLSGLRRSLSTVLRDWKMSFAKNGEEALDLMSTSSFDVVVSDMNMPKMNGVELFNTIMERYPDTVRIILSGLVDNEMIMKSLNYTHQFLVKPCDPNTIKYTIQRACSLRDLLRDKALRQIVTVTKELPSLPTIYNEVMKEMKSPDASLKNVSDIISQDAPMTAKILQIVNSAFFGIRHTITDPQQAATYLGIETLKALILSSHVFSSFTEDMEFFGQSMEMMSRHSLMVGSLAKAIARSEKAEPNAVEDTFVSGLLHDIGKLILIKSPIQYRKIGKIIDNNWRDTTIAEYMVINTSHAELGAYLLALWGLPERIVETVAFHHNPLKLLESSLSIKYQSLDKNPDDAKRNNVNLDSELLNKYINEFSVLTFVHVANGLIMQKDNSSDTTTFPFIDMDYLEKLGLTDKLPEWVECYNELMQKE
ncbi:MAG: HDOD domain-containing protein [Candidatus Scalindua sp.]|jgi:putative nucleotidyltransferase with HDIG domain|nr:HDOD domain-containing protein [Candidatus Scalindua sp.]MBT5304957.1 HDOD domain-containing protein [Candidatus Scalindua sp.]MBT6049887.1 HDOD domain-containing protein [Candidatus Scalindua sp.]MBT6229032.1 HDOD domain-containing protein [Candidatus Scalindua sp.]MBT6564571.1 HDOD domain-containing protein [Candidatus Scalindua sp.]